jgi:hypothetical protein
MDKKVVDYKRRIQNQNIIITALAIIIFVMVAVSATAAWYITTRTDTVDIVLGDPVNPYITSFDKILGEDDPLYDIHSVTENLLGNNTRVYPGDQITMKLGFQLGDGQKASSPAYVRVKLNIVYEDKNGNFKGLSEVGVKGYDPNAKIYYEDEPDSNLWQLVDFNKFRIEKNLLDENGNPYEHDYWYVLKDSKDVAKVAYNGEPYTFLDGYIKLDKINNTNADANAKFHFQYVAEVWSDMRRNEICNESIGLSNSGKAT